MSIPRGAAASSTSRWWPPILWAAVILGMTSWPNPGLTAAPEGTDKVVHLGAYGVLGFLVARARASRGVARLLRALTAIAGFAALDELHQILVPGRSASTGDFAADVIGAAIGLLAGHYLHSLARPRQDLPT